jgi:FMN-dependent NADH-azoreductase
MRWLHIEASPRADKSTSSVLARELLSEALTKEDALDTFPIWREQLPDMDGPLLSGKYARLEKRAFTAEEEEAWARAGALVERLAAADHLLISTPMWNFGIPYRLKHWIDVITQPGLSFSFDPETGYAPLLSARPVTIILSSAGDYRGGPSWGRPDLASSYLSAALQFIGLECPKIFQAGPTAGPPETWSQARERVRRELSSHAARRERIA